MHVRTPAALILTVIMATALPALPGCGPHLGGYDYNAGEARQANSIYYGTACRRHVETFINCLRWRDGKRGCCARLPYAAMELGAE